jgi:lycopene beta-cyclase
MTIEADLLILGGGCAGLSLAARLAAAGRGVPRTRVLESRAAYCNDRTWCFWADATLGVEHLIAYEWRHLHVRAGAAEARIDCRLFPYQMLPAERFYADARERIAASSRVDLVTDAAVLGEPRRIRAGWRVSTRAGEFSAARIIDTRPPQAPAAGDAVLWQSFSGAVLECERPVFDPDRAVLMDFDESSGEAVRFRYVLPTSPTTALVETTVFERQPRSRAALAGLLRGAIHREIGSTAHRVVRREHGILPMGLTQRVFDADPSYIHAGLVAGAARASTGYAFQRIQRWAALCSESLSAGGPSVRHPPEPAARAVMDRIFLQVLRTHPARAPQVFAQLFARASSERVIRFLSDRGSCADHAAVVAALPTGLFLSCLPGLITSGLFGTRSGLAA